MQAPSIPPPPAAAGASQGLWAFSLDLYGRPGVAAACLALQDGAGADVNLVLYALWLGLTGRGAFDPACVERVAPWREQVVLPLRAVRRALTLRDGFRAQVKALELEAERRQQAMLEAAAPPPAGDPAPGQAAANLDRYLGLLARPADPAAVAVILAALCGPAAAAGDPPPRPSG
ncbi:MAG: hypothetical protein OHK0024_13630 [Thalassobaculales bacterium]